MMVRAEGFEPPQPFGHKILSLARLPVPPRPHCKINELRTTYSDSSPRPRRSKTESVTWPLILLAVIFETPARIILRTAARRKSWGRIDTPEASHILAQATRKSRTAEPSAQAKTASPRFLIRDAGLSRSGTSFVILIVRPLSFCGAWRQV